MFDAVEKCHSMASLAAICSRRIISQCNTKATVAAFVRYLATLQLEGSARFVGRGIVIYE